VFYINRPIVKLMHYTANLAITERRFRGNWGTSEGSTVNVYWSDGFGILI